jgi:hypothetical protein
MLLQRDLQEESAHISRLIQAAQAAVEAGQRPPDPLMRATEWFLLLMPELTSSAQPCQGAGEAAPWAEMDLAQQPVEQAEQLKQRGGDGAHQGAGGAEVQQRAVLAAQAAAAAGVPAPGQLGAMRPDWRCRLRLGC